MQHGGSAAALGQTFVEGTGTDLPGEQQSKTRQPKKMPELNVVAMLDVCFNLLIFFIATVSFSVGEGVLPAELPVGQGGVASDTDAPKTPIKIMMRNLGGDHVAIEIENGGTVDTFADLYMTLAGLQRNASNPNGIYPDDSPVIIQPDATVAWDAVVNAFNQAVRAKYTNVNFAQPSKN